MKPGSKGGFTLTETRIVWGLVKGLWVPHNYGNMYLTVVVSSMRQIPDLMQRVSSLCKKTKNLNWNPATVLARYWGGVIGDWSCWKPAEWEDFFFSFHLPTINRLQSLDLATDARPYKNGISSLSLPFLIISYMSGVITWIQHRIFAQCFVLE